VENIVEPDRLQMTIRRMRFAFSVTKAKNTHSDYVILIALPLPQRLHERTLVLRYTYFVCLVFCGLRILIGVSCCIAAVRSYVDSR
jgi:hypothetical protein